MRIFKLQIACLAILLALALLVQEGLASKKKRKPFSSEELEPLLTSLVEEGFPRKTLNDIFYDSRLRKIERVVGLNSINQESERIYKQFYSPYALRLAARFRKRNLGLFMAHEQRFGVPVNYVIAILLVETQFGRARLPFRVLDVFTTLVIEANPASVERHFLRLKADYPDLEKEFLEMRLGAKAEWAFQELVALMNIGSKRKKLDLLEVKGSYAGAMGLPQFLPSSYNRWAVDGNGDKKIDLNNLSDAVASIGNYLREHGWKKGTGLKQKMRAVWEYNHSPPYVDAIFTIARKLKLPSRKRVRKS